MKSTLKVMASVFLLSLVAVPCATADFIEWASSSVYGGGSSGYDIVDRFGNVITEAQGWTVGLFNAANNALLYESNAGWDDDYPGEWYLVIPANNTWNGLTVFTRFFDAPTISAANYFADTEPFDLAWVPSAPPNPPTTVPYDIGTISASDWQMIPEPGSAALVLIGLGAALIRRRIA